MYITVLSNHKGGTGKTSNTVAAAALLAKRGYKVLALDGDAQGNLATAFGLPKSPRLYDLLVRGAAWKDVILTVPPERFAVVDEAITGALYIVPSNKETRLIAQEMHDGFLLLKRLRQLRDVIDYVLIDTSPTHNGLHAAFYSAADAVIFPTECEKWSIDGMTEAVGEAIEITRMREERGLPGLRLGGILPTLYQSGTNEHVENKAKLEAFAVRHEIPVLPPISKAIAWAEAASAARSIFAIAPNSNAAKQARRFVDHLEGLAQ